jgi:hypothetical protein
MKNVRSMRVCQAAASPLSLHGFVTLAVLVLLPCTAVAQTSSSESFGLTLTPTAGAAESSSESFRMIASIDATGIVGRAVSDSFAVDAGGVELLFTSPADDEDADSVSNEEEASINGGDGNGDSVPDQLQPFVASLQGITTPVNAEIREGGCTSISLAEAIAASTLGASPRFGFPYDLVRIRLRCGEPGDDTLIRLRYFAGDDPVWPPEDVRAFGVRAPDFDGTPSYFSLPVEGTGLETVGDARVAWIDVRLTDGMFGDTDAGEGEIELTCGPAWPSRPIRR